MRLGDLSGAFKTKSQTCLGRSSRLATMARTGKLQGLSQTDHHQDSGANDQRQKQRFISISKWMLA